MESMEEQFLEGIYHPFPEEAEKQNDEFKEENEEQGDQQEELNVENEEPAPHKQQRKGTVWLCVCVCFNVHHLHRQN